MKKHTILIVDDQSVNRKILSRLLADDYTILEAENGVQALEVMRANRKTIAAVLLDIVMPVLDGYGVLEAMRQDEELRKLPVIVSSQKDGDEAEVRALSLGAQDFIAKPYKGDIIRHRLENTIRLRETAAIANRAEKDELTGLLNKQFFIEQVGELLHQNPDVEYEMLCFDIERFKLVNDTYGEKTGDELLKYVAGLLSESKMGLLTSRFTADHFYQLIRRPDEEALEEYRTFLDKLTAFPIEMKLNISCGVYPIKNIDASVGGMCDRARLAAEQNRDRADCLYTLYDDSIRKRMLEEQFIIGSMREGLEQHQFEVYYQPKYDLHTEMVAGAEALVRWIHPERGFLSPGAFIPIFEKNGFITQLDRYVWEQACSDLRRWMDAGLPPVPVSVNVSRADIFNPNLPEILVDLVNKYDIPMPYLHLEITESAYTDNPDQIIAVVERLHDLGFTIEMDDFGSGYSSLNMLAELPVDILKLDMHFVQSETLHTSGRGIMSFVISLAKWMKLAVIAEGVETAEQIESLRSMDCNFVQGFYYARPMPRDAFEELLATVAVSAPNAVKERPAAPARPAVPHDRVLLVVDDIEVNRAVLTSVFEGEYEVVQKADGRQALDYLRTCPDRVEIILLDLLMPVMDGFQLLRALQQDEKLRDIPVVVTSQGDVNAEEKALELGAEDFISKPYSPQVVSHRVHNVVQAHRVLERERRELTEAQRREQTLMESIPGGVALYRLKKDGRITTEYASDGLAALLGYGITAYMKLVREDARPLLAEEDLPRLATAYRVSLTTGTLLHELVHMRARDGRLIPMRADARVLPAEDAAEDESAVLYAVLTRVSEETVNALQEQSRYRYILDNLDIAYFEYDASGMSYASDKYSLYAMSNLPMGDILEQGALHIFVHTEDMPALLDFYRLKNEKIPKISATLRVKMNDGGYRWTELIAFYEYDIEGVCQKTIGVLRDVDNAWQNQHRRLQEALDAAERANREKTDFLARVSHEMRTPLNGIMGLAELLAADPGEKEKRRYVEQLHQSGKYLLQLIDDTLDVSTIEQGRLELHPAVCDGKTVLTNVIALVKPSILAKKLKFDLQVAELPFTKLYIDVGRVEQAMMNILTNAIKFTQEGGTITFKMENVSYQDGVITDRIVVRDTGIGMSKEFVKHLFEPFEQEHNDSHSIYRGTGLGMTIAKQCIELMGGEIEVESEPGVGTTVTVLLPMRVATPDQLERWHRSGDAANLKGKRVLLCEDHPLNAQIAIRLLESRGVQVEHAENGRAGLALFTASVPNYYDAVLMDIRMPVMDGLEATRKIRALDRPDARRVPIIAMTANALRQDVKNALNAGMSEHLGKPVEPERLFETLGQLINDPAPYAGKKILVVDDIELNRAFLRSAIKATYTVLEAANGEQALELLAREPDIAAVITDIQMPVMDGKELIRRIRAQDKYAGIAILANTIYGDHRQEDELLSLGANDFVYKPTSAQVVMLRLGHILRNKERMEG